MEPNHQIPQPRTRLPAADDPLSGAHPTAVRRAGVRAVRRASNWTAAALIAGTAAAAGYFAHATHVTSVTPGTAAVTGKAAGRPATGPASCHQPVVSAPVVTSGGSGVVVQPAGGACGASGGGGTGRAVIVYRDN